jgi:hypothetical protein
MMKILSSSMLLATLLIATPAFAGGSKGAIGVGAELQLSGVSGIGVDYDAGMFHVGGLVGAANPDGADNGDIQIGAHFYYHVASTSMSDFGVGGGIGIDFNRLGDPGDDNQTNIFLDPGFQIRAFIASNVALSFTGGFTIGVGDSKGFALGAAPNAAAGVSYYFF